MEIMSKDFLRQSLVRPAKMPNDIHLIREDDEYLPDLIDVVVHDVELDFVQKIVADRQ